MENFKPPKWIDRLLANLISPKEIEFILGDLHEIYAEEFSGDRRFKSRLKYLYYALGFIRPHSVKKIDFQQLNVLFMIGNYFKIAARKLIKNKIYSIINIAGLAVGFACCMLIGQYIRHELSYDRYHQKHKRIFRMANFAEGASYENGIAKVNAPWGPAAKESIPGVIESCRFVFYGQALVERDKYKNYENGGLYADSTAFKLFDWKFLSGDPKTALSEPNSLVITKHIAERYFPDENPIGKVLRFDNETEMEVTGVLEDIPENSHFSFNFLVSLITYIPPDRGNEWSMWNQYYTYLLLDSGDRAKQVEKEMDAIIADHISPELSESWRPMLQPIWTIHLESKLHREMATNSDKSYIFIFGFIAAFILIIACTNFVNLSTARATQRAKEVGVRKVVGANKNALIQQFVGESLFIASIAAIFSVLLAKAALGQINLLLNRELELNLISDYWIGGSLLLVTLFAGIMSGIYPAFVLSAFKPAQVLKDNVNRGGGIKGFGGISQQVLLRKSLVVFQFTIAGFLIIFGLVVNGQLKFIQSKNLGFNKDQIINVPFSTQESIRRSSIIKQEISNLPGVVMVSVSANRPGGSDYGVPYVAVNLPEDQQPSMRCLVIDEDFIETYEMEMASGRDFSQGMSTDSTAYLVNETAALQLGWDNVVGEKLAMPAIGREAAPIIGVVKDFNFRSLHEPISPLYFFLETSWFSQLNIRLDAGRVQETLSLLEEKWREIEPDYPFRYSFFDESFGSLHAAEESTAGMIKWCTILAILITCLGLFGLSTFTAEMRLREIGIRKVFGASMLDILKLLSKDVVFLVLLSMCIAIPVAWMVSSNWLNGFAYNVGLGLKYFAIATAIAVGIALITVSYHTVRSAISKPMNSLRHE